MFLLVFHQIGIDPLKVFTTLEELVVSNLHFFGYCYISIVYAYFFCELSMQVLAPFLITSTWPEDK